MGMFPIDFNVLPDVYGPTQRELIKIDSGYLFGWTSRNQWGGPDFEGSIKELAKLIFLFHFGNHTSIHGYNTRFYGVSFVATKDLHIDFKPIVNCIFNSEDIDKEQFLEELRVELEKLKILISFT